MTDLFGRTAREEAVDVLHCLTAIYTHEPVVDELLDSIAAVWPRGLARLLDPSVGAGAFICRALERLMLSQPEIDDASIIRVLAGYEIHPLAAEEARTQLARILSRHGRAWSTAMAVAQQMVRIGDFLLDAHDGVPVAAFCTNPPYARMLRVPAILRADYEMVVPDFARGDLLHAFLERASAQLAPGGMISLITSDGWLMGQGAAKLRAELSSKLGISRLERVDADSAFYQPKDRRRGTPPRVNPVLVVLQQASCGTRPLGSAPIFPGVEEEPASAGTLTLGQVATVRVAPWMGTPGIFVVDRAVAANFPADEIVPVVDTDDLRGDVLGTPTRVALRTTRSRQPSAAVLAHLDANLHRMCQRGRRPTRWLPPESLESFDLQQEHLLIPRIAKTLRAVRMPVGTLAINHNLTCVSNGQLSLSEIQEILSSDRSRKWVMDRAPRLEGGYLSITTRFLRDLPVG